MEITTKRINIEVEEKVWLKVGIIAAMEDKTKKTIIHEALKDYFEKNKGYFLKN